MGAQWLQDLGLPNYEALFREQAIDADVLPSLTDADFEKLVRNESILDCRQQAIRGWQMFEIVKVLVIAACAYAGSAVASIQFPKLQDCKEACAEIAGVSSSTFEVHQKQFQR
jgi:hypothetical protein